MLSCYIHNNFRNGVNTELAKEEFVSLKLVIVKMFKDKTYLSLWEMTKEPYCSVLVFFRDTLISMSNFSSIVNDILI